MSKRTITIKITVDLESQVAKQWGSKEDYFDTEISEVMQSIEPFIKRGESKSQSQFGTTKDGSQYSFNIKKHK